MNEWGGYDVRELRELYREEQPEDFVQQFPPPERQPLPDETRHRPITADLLARRESRRFGLIIGQPWTNAFRRLMSDPKTMRHMKNSFPVRWALAMMAPKDDWSDPLREKRNYTLRIMTLYMASNYEPDLIAALLRTHERDVWAELGRGARIASGLIGPLGRDFVELMPEAVQADLEARGMVEKTSKSGALTARGAA